ncbi:uncharacterized protein LOC115767377 [Drosophila novamexicana]|uniref:uncharacterized protein LOC115767377 n=1 Tax=Drosophila novamexicana TaxID=47314 RepID=UPI0011E5EEE5|nr:uncharacterized protein LOC115767377 [Drosophila novamexicana]
MDKKDLHVLICTECYHALPARAQIRQFGMCDMCKKNNPDLRQYLEKYVYDSERTKNWDPIGKRLHKISQKCELLKIKMAAVERKYFNKPTLAKTDEMSARTEQLLPLKKPVPGAVKKNVNTKPEQ